jgi:hypothetical protein
LFINNNCHNELLMFGYNGIACNTEADFNNATAFESNGIGGTVGLSDPGAADFTFASPRDVPFTAAH